MLINSAYRVEFIFYKFYLLEICNCKDYEIRILKLQNILPIQKKKKKTWSNVINRLSYVPKRYKK